MPVNPSNGPRRILAPLCLCALILIAGCAPAPQLPESRAEARIEPPLRAIPQPPPSPEQLAEQRRKRLACQRTEIAAVGDIMLGTDFPENRLADDPDALLADAAPLLRAADVAIGNLEGVLQNGGEPFKTCKDPSACYLFRSPGSYAAVLANAGFDVMSLANNHARDFGEDGRSASMAALDAAGIVHSGRAGEVARWSKGDVRFGFIAFAPFSGSWPMLDIDAAAAAVTQLAGEADIVIVSFHGGAEGTDAARIPFTTEFYYGEDRGNVVEFSRAMIDAGADLVVGHGPHVPRAMEVYADRLIAYSLGNFATYYGINVTGAKGFAPVLVSTLDGNGRFIAGQIVSHIQRRPLGPQADVREQAFGMMRELTMQDFNGGNLRFGGNGTFEPAFFQPDDCPTR